MKEKLAKIKEAALAQIEAVDADLEQVKIRYLGKKGELTAVLRGMGSLSAEERPQIGQLANEVRSTIEEAIAKRVRDAQAKALEHRLEAEKLDVTMPASPVPDGHIHPLTKVQRELEDIFIGMGFSIVEGPEVELDYYNFQALNIPENHPARDTQDTFYITDNILLRSQTSPVQVRTMEHTKPPIRIISPGRVYRSDALDATHSPLFHQLEGLVVDEGITMGDLKGTLATFAKRMFGESTRIRFRPHQSPSPSRRLKWTFPASSAAARAAGFARARAGLKFSAPAWCIRSCCRTVTSTPKNTPALRSGLASSGLQWRRSASMIFGCSTKTTNASLSSSETGG